MDYHAAKKQADRSDIIPSMTVWRAMGRAGISSIKEPLDLLRDDGERPDGVTMFPWSGGRCVAWDVTVPDTFAATHLPLTSITPSAAAEEPQLTKR